MADVQFDGDSLTIKLSILDALMAFHGSFHIPLAHVTNAYVSDFEDLELQYQIEGMPKMEMSAVGVFTNPSGLVFCDIDDDCDFLVIETSGERFPRIAVQLPASMNPNTLAHEIMSRVPDNPN